MLRPQRLHKNLPENIRAQVNSEDLRGLNYCDPYSLSQLRGIPGDGPVLPSGVVEGLNNKAKVTTRRSYGFRTFRVTELALYHSLGKLPEPKLTHGFY